MSKILTFASKPSQKASLSGRHLEGKPHNEEKVKQGQTCRLFGFLHAHFHPSVRMKINIFF